MIILKQLKRKRLVMITDINKIIKQKIEEEKKWYKEEKE